MKNTPIVLGALLVGFGLGFVADRYLSRDSADGSSQAQLQGCWSAGNSTLLIRRGDRKMRLLEARVADQPWRRLQTRDEDQAVLASFEGGEGELRLSIETDLLTSSGFSDAPNTSWRRCEAVPPAA